MHLNLSELARSSGVGRARIAERLKAGWTLEDALKPPAPVVSTGTKRNPDGNHPDDIPCGVCGKPMRRPEWMRKKGLRRACGYECARIKIRRDAEARKSVELGGVLVTRDDLAELAGTGVANVDMQIRKGKTPVYVITPWAERILRKRLAKAGA